MAPYPRHVVSELRIVEIEKSAATKLAPDRAYVRLVEQFNAWWVAPMRSPDCHSAQIEHRVGGSVIEDHGSAAGRCLGTIRELTFGSSVTFDGAFGLDGAFGGDVTMTIEPSEDGTTVRVVQRAFGPITDAAIDAQSAGWTEGLAAFDGVDSVGRGAGLTPRPAV